jgi:hypothetical protein
MNKSRRTVLGVILGGVIAVGLPAPRVVGAERDIKLSVRVLRVPSQQSFEAVFLSGQGRPVTFQASGDVTFAFPRGTVFFQTDLAASASDGAIAGAIFDRVPLGYGGFAAKQLRIEELKALELELGSGHSKAEARFAESRGEGRSSNYEVRAELLSAGTGKVLVRIRFDAGWSSQGGRLGVMMSEDVVSAPFEVPESKILLIGGVASGTVYWLAVSAVPKG